MPRKPKKFSISAPITRSKFYTMAFQREVQKIAKGYVGFEYDESKCILKCEFLCETDAINFQQKMKDWI